MNPKYILLAARKSLDTFQNRRSAGLHFVVRGLPGTRIRLRDIARDHGIQHGWIRRIREDAVAAFFVVPFTTEGARALAQVSEVVRDLPDFEELASDNLVDGVRHNIELNKSLRIFITDSRLAGFSRIGLLSPDPEGAVLASSRSHSEAEEGHYYSEE